MGKFGWDSFLLFIFVPPKNTKLKAVRYTQKTWCRPMQGSLQVATPASVSSHELCSSWFRGFCSPGVLYPLWLLDFFTSFFTGLRGASPWAPRGRSLMEISHLRLYIPRSLCGWSLTVGFYIWLNRHCWSIIHRMPLGGILLLLFFF